MNDKLVLSFIENAVDSNFLTAHTAHTFIALATNIICKYVDFHSVMLAAVQQDVTQCSMSHASALHVTWHFLLC
jgi:hypothetical protein